MAQVSSLDDKKELLNNLHFDLVDEAFKKNTSKNMIWVRSFQMNDHPLFTFSDFLSSNLNSLKEKNLSQNGKSEKSFWRPNKMKELTEKLNQSDELLSFLDRQWPEICKFLDEQIQWHTKIISSDEMKRIINLVEYHIEWMGFRKNLTCVQSNQFYQEILDNSKHYVFNGLVNMLKNLESWKKSLDGDAAIINNLWLSNVYGKSLFRHQLTCEQKNHDDIFSDFKKLDSINIAQGPMDLKTHIESIEINMIEQTIKKFRGNKNQASKYLGLNRTTLIEKMKKYKIYSNIEY